MNDNEINTQEAVNEVTTESNNITLDNLNMEWTKDTLAELTVDYHDISVLLEDTEELKLVNDFFKSISCRR